MEPTDEVLMMAYQHGETAALETLVRRYADPLLGYLTRMTSSRQSAEDVFQETFLRVHRKASSFRTSGRFKPWLYSIATHLAVDALRRREPTVSLEEKRDERNSLAERLPDPGRSPADAAALADQQTRVREAIATLPPRQRATLVLTYFEGQSYPEAAATLGCSVGTVKTQMSRALRALARRLPEARPAGGTP